MNDIALGVAHITDWQGYDHMLYLLALVARYDLRHAGKAALLATAFTLGHSLTLAIASLDVFRVPGAWVEFLIPVTILGTALWGLFHGDLGDLHKKPSLLQEKITHVKISSWMRKESYSNSKEAEHSNSTTNRQTYGVATA